MAEVRAFCCTRPNKEVVCDVAALPYDVYSREEAKKETEGRPLSFLNIDRPETQFEPDFDMYSDKAYEKAASLLRQRIEEGVFVRDKDRAFYVYELTMDGRSQTGIAACCLIDEYLDNTIRKHENTRRDKEEDRVRHVDTCSAQTGPIFLAYRYESSIKAAIDEFKKREPLYDFVSEDGIGHRVWKIADKSDINLIAEAFKKVERLYIADGHHRAASAVRAGLKRREENPHYTGEEEFNFFLAVLFADEELRILPYNRAVRDLNGMNSAEFLEKLKESFLLSPENVRCFAPDRRGSFGMYIDGRWYRLDIKPGFISDDPVGGLDVSILQDRLLEPLLGISDPRSDRRIEFAGGIRGAGELEKMVDSGEFAVAFSMYPTQMSELLRVSDADLLMPPKSTWFEPKLRSGIFIHEL